MHPINLPRIFAPGIAHREQNAFREEENTVVYSSIISNLKPLIDTVAPFTNTLAPPTERRAPKMSAVMFFNIDREPRSVRE
jgi:hypothetical protein